MISVRYYKFLEGRCTMLQNKLSANKAAAPWQRYQAVYVHVPFCVQKCLYCDFASYAGFGTAQK